MLAVCWGGRGWCAQVVGTVSDAAGKPVPGIAIVAVDQSGKVAGQSVSGVHGNYLIDGLSPGKYVFRLEPRATGMQGGNGVAYLSAAGLTVNWTVSPDALALDDATTGTGFSIASVMGPLLTPAAIPVAGGVIAGAVLGGLGAAGSLGGGSTSPSL